MSVEYTSEAVTEILADVKEIVVRPPAQSGGIQVSFEPDNNSFWRDHNKIVELLTHVRNKLESAGYAGVSISLSRRDQKSGVWAFSPSVWVNPQAAKAAEQAQKEEKMQKRIDQLENLLGAVANKLGVETPEAPEETPDDAPEADEEDQPFAD